jgi:undecaprenyl phosphate-alpha-L-ara4N flippase subunit ArnF
MDGITVMTTRRNAYLCMAASILLSTLAQLCMKASMLLIAQGMQAGGELLTSLLEPSVLAWLFVGLGSYALSMIFWLFAIVLLELSLAYPMLSLSYVLVYVVAVNWPLLNENVSWVRTLGIVVVILGVVLIVRSENHPLVE